MKIILYIVIAVGAVYAASIITPDSIKSRTLAAIGLSDFSIKQTISNTAGELKDKIVPETPTEKRERNLELLEKTLADIKAAQGEHGSQDLLEASSRAMAEADQLLAELKKDAEENQEGAVSKLIRSTANLIDKAAGPDEPAECSAQ